MVRTPILAVVEVKVRLYFPQHHMYTVDVCYVDVLCHNRQGQNRVVFALLVATAMLPW